MKSSSSPSSGKSGVPSAVSTQSGKSGVATTPAQKNKGASGPSTTVATQPNTAAKIGSSSQAGAPKLLNKKGGNAESAKPADPTPPSHEEISERAKRLWQNAGGPSGRDFEFWYAAEAELRSERGNKQ